MHLVFNILTLIFFNNSLILLLIYQYYIFTFDYYKVTNVCENFITIFSLLQLKERNCLEGKQNPRIIEIL